MSIRLPSVRHPHSFYDVVRHPHSFYDVFTVVVAAVVIMALVLAVRYGSLIRIEMAVFMIIVFLWAGWAIERILAESKERSKRRGKRSSWDQ